MAISNETGEKSHASKLCAANPIALHLYGQHFDCQQSIFLYIQTVQTQKYDGKQHSLQMQYTIIWIHRRYKNTHK